MPCNLPAGFAIPEPDVGNETLELGRVRIERRQSLFGVISGYDFEPRFLQRRLDVEQDQRFVLNDQNRTDTHLLMSPIATYYGSAAVWFQRLPGTTRQSPVGGVQSLCKGRARHIRSET